MKANVQYNDFIGTAAADISDPLGFQGGNDINQIAKHFKLDEERFKPVGISIYGPDGFWISLICVDKERSTADKEHIVKMSVEVENEREILDFLFKRLQIVLYDKFDNIYPNMDIDEEARFEDFHDTEEDTEE